VRHDIPDDVRKQVEQWEARYRTAFERDGGRRFATDIERFGLSVTSADMLEGTVDLVIACVALRQVDRLGVSDFLGRQAYDGPHAADAPYRLLFDLGASAGVVVADQDLRLIDLADLYDTAWPRLQRVGYSGFWVTRSDGRDLEPVEVTALDAAITSDLRFDNAEHEVRFYFDPDTWVGSLNCVVYDHHEEDEE
jgi:hypothetical protein